MRRSLLALIWLCACRERNPAFMPDPVTTSDASAGEVGSSGVPSTESSTAITSASETTSDPGESSSAVTTGEVTTGDSAGSETGEPVAPYPACDPDTLPCPRGYDHCIVEGEPLVSWCSHWCVHTDDCEAPLTGEAPLVCWGHDCMLDCTDGQVCPDGMVCAIVSGNGRCGWPS